MIELLDGPAKGTYAVRRAPMYLRAVVDPDGKRDVLDQLDDEPNGIERIHVYRIEPGTWGQVFVRPGGCYATGRYRRVPEVEGEDVRRTEAWREWAQAQEPIE